MVFEAFAKIPRLNRDCTITEKIDGSNAQVYIVSNDEAEREAFVGPFIALSDDKQFRMYAGSRTRLITPEADNFGFAAWVKENATELFKLGPGRHFGEWWGGKIQRGYGIREKRFSLFNAHRWADRNFGDITYIGDGKVGAVPGPKQQFAPACCRVAPTLYVGPFGTDTVNKVMAELKEHGSHAQIGFMNPEGIVVYHAASRTQFKVTFDHDEISKGEAATLAA